MLCINQIIHFNKIKSKTVYNCKLQSPPRSKILQNKNMKTFLNFAL